jgi:hypothetical protein
LRASGDAFTRALDAGSRADDGPAPSSTPAPTPSEAVGCDVLLAAAAPAGTRAAGSVFATAA